MLVRLVIDPDGPGPHPAGGQVIDLPYMPTPGMELRLPDRILPVRRVVMLVGAPAGQPIADVICFP
jgi:hypothetical protein